MAIYSKNISLIKNNIEVGKLYKSSLDAWQWTIVGNSKSTGKEEPPANPLRNVSQNKTSLTITSKTNNLYKVS